MLLVTMDWGLGPGCGRVVPTWWMAALTRVCDLAVALRRNKTLK